MNELRLRFGDGDQPDLVLGSGVHALGRLPTGLGPVDAEQPWLLQLCNDRRGIWLTVADYLRGVHVNGRPVREKAILRAFVVAIFALGLFPQGPLAKTELAARDYQQRVLASRVEDTTP